MKRSISVFAVAATVVALSSSAFAGTYQILNQPDEDGVEREAKHYSKVTAEAYAEAFGVDPTPGDGPTLITPVEREDADPELNPNGTQSPKMNYSTASFAWVPDPDVENDLPVHFKIKHSYQSTAFMFVERSDPMATASASASSVPPISLPPEDFDPNVFLGINNWYDLDLEDDIIYDGIETTPHDAEATFTVIRPVGAQVVAHATAVGGGASADSYASMSTETTGIELLNDNDGG